MHMAHLLNWVDTGAQVPNEIDINNFSMPPMVELEMLVSLYFPSFEPSRQLFMKRVQDFGKLGTEVQYRRYREETKGSKQTVSSKLWDAIKLLHKETESFQIEISKIIKA